VIPIPQAYDPLADAKSEGLGWDMNPSPMPLVGIGDVYQPHHPWGARPCLCQSRGPSGTKDRLGCSAEASLAPLSKVQAATFADTAHAVPGSAACRQIVGWLRGLSCQTERADVARWLRAAWIAAQILSPAGSPASQAGEPILSRRQNGLERRGGATDDAAHVALSFAHCLSRRPAH
jgi:hypothetical protein